MTRPRILAYYFPNWHPDLRNRTWFGDGWTEWNLVRSARPRFAGHRQPRVPLLGHFDESAPPFAAQQIDLAADNGIDGFLIDFYWYADGSYLEDGIQALFDAPNSPRMELALMWANHRLVDLFPADPAGQPELRNGKLDRDAFEQMGEHIVANYFTHPAYLKIDGRPWFSIYELNTFINGMGGLRQAREALEWLDGRTRAAGFPGVHIDAVVWGISVLPGGDALDEDPTQLLEQLGARSATSYVWVHHADLSTYDFPEGDAKRLRNEAFTEYRRYSEKLTVPFYPNVTVGWDASPRTPDAADFVPRGYPWTPVFDISPAEFEDSLREAAAFVDGMEAPIITINAWNEWGEGSALLPDQDHGYGYLSAIKSTFGPQVANRDVAEPGRQS